MREKLFTLSRSQREDMWRRFKQSDDRRIAERLHAILLLDSGMNATAVATSLHLHPNTLKRWGKAFASGGEEALLRFHCAARWAHRNASRPGQQPLAHRVPCDRLAAARGSGGLGFSRG